MALREGNYTLLGYRTQEFERDTKRIEQLVAQMRPLIEKEAGRKLQRSELFSLIFNSSFRNKETERLRTEFVGLQQFQESWTPAIKRGMGGFRKFELYDLASDPGQRTDLAPKRPIVLERMKKQLLRINAGVLADAPTWGTAKSPTPPSGLEQEGKDLQNLLARIEATELPAAYSGREHQPYVDRRVAAMTERQRARLGFLWKEKQRLDPDMRNRGQSFIRILEFAAKEPVPQP